VNDPAPTHAAARRVAALVAVDRRGRRVRVELESGEPFGDTDAPDDRDSLELALEVIERAGLGCGDPVDDALRARLLDDDLRWRARDVALGFLAYRPRSRGEVRRRLKTAAFPPAVIEACLDRLAADGLLDDGAFAAAFVRDRLRLKPKGPARLRDELRKRGVDGTVVETAIRDGLAEAGQTDESIAVSVALRWLNGRGAREREALASGRFGEARDAALHRLIGFLRRRGFGGEAVRSAVAAVDAAVRE
jgi:regulatory protein